MDINRAKADPLFLARKKLLEEAARYSGSKTDAHPPLALGALLGRMREAACHDPGLASIYFAGAEGDHPYFLKNQQVSIGISVLPEDAEKCAQAKRHPHQQEIIIILEGNLRLFTRRDGTTSSEELACGEMRVIEKDQCHWLLADAGKTAAFMFIKTCPSREPRGVACPPPPEP